MEGSQMSVGGETPAVPPPETPAPTPARPGDAVVGVSVLLSALAVWLAIWAAWEVETTYARFRGRTDLDMPDWFTINMSLLTTALAFGTLAGFCQFVA
jgi:hypothetical protein